MRLMKLPHTSEPWAVLTGFNSHLSLSSLCAKVNQSNHGSSMFSTARRRFCQLGFAGWEKSVTLLLADVQTSR